MQDLPFYRSTVFIIVAADRRLYNGNSLQTDPRLSFRYIDRVPSAKGEDRKSLMDTLPDLKVIDDVIHKSLVFGFLWLSAGIITGAIWANSAWGTYWSWDPKETWSLITWFIYAALVHARMTIGWRGRKAAYLCIVGFAAILFTFLGVNLVLGGLHSYN